MSNRALAIIVGVEWMLLGCAVGWLCVESFRLAAVSPQPPVWLQILLVPVFTALVLGPWVLIARGVDFIEGKR